MAAGKIVSRKFSSYLGVQLGISNIPQLVKSIEMHHNTIDVAESPNCVGF